MTRALILCGGAATPPGELSSTEFDRLVALELGGNLRIDLEHLEQAALGNLDPTSTDLVEMACYVYAADKAVSRAGAGVDVHARLWRRQFAVVLPVRERTRWEGPAKAVLEQVLAYVTGDSWVFHFVDHQRPTERPKLHFSEESRRIHRASHVTLFSGGIDSLCGILHEHLGAEDSRPILLSHHATPVVRTRQDVLLTEVRRRYRDWPFPRVAVSTLQVGESHENTQRSRSFLYLALASALAHNVGIDLVRCFENGPVSLNPHRSGQQIGTMRTRTTHPRFVHLFGDLLAHLYDKPPRIETPFILRTKKEVIQVLCDVHATDLAPYAISCAKTVMAPREAAHCGICSQCIDRRFAMVAAGLDFEEERATYRVDIFTDELLEGEARANGENLLRTAADMRRRNLDAFFEEYTELWDAVRHLPAETPEDAAASIYAMFQRLADEVLAVGAVKHQEHYAEYFAGELPPHCLLSMVAYGEHTIPLVERTVAALQKVLTEGLRPVFQDAPPPNERAVQNAAQGCLAAASERLVREGPMLPYGCVMGKPDFSTRDGGVYIELKLLRPGSSDRRRVTNEVNGKILEYREHGASVLFAIYDQQRTLSDGTTFVADFVKHPGVWACVI